MPLGRGELVIYRAFILGDPERLRDRRGAQRRVSRCRRDVIQPGQRATAASPGARGGCAALAAAGALGHEPHHE